MSNFVAVRIAGETLHVDNGTYWWTVFTVDSFGKTLDAPEIMNPHGRMIKATGRLGQQILRAVDALQDA